MSVETSVGWLLERPEVRAEVEALGLLIRETNSSLLAFALYRSVLDREPARSCLEGTPAVAGAGIHALG